MFCSSCGSKSTEGAGFCASCGRALDASPSSLNAAVGSLPKENIVSVFRAPTSAAHAAKKRAWAFSSGAVFIGIGLVNLVIGSSDKGFNWVIGILALIAGIALVGQALLLMGYGDR